MTRYAYNKKTFRLERLRTDRFTKIDDLSYQSQGKVLQDFHYVYDIAGNILKINDRTPEGGLPTDPDILDRTFIYDPIYRLVSATGREYDRLQPVIPPWLNTITPQDPTKTRFYMRHYQYDRAGNLTELKHVVNGNTIFRRLFEIVADNNRLSTVNIGQSTFTYRYDDNGNLCQENTERHFTWDHSDRLIAFTNQAEESPHASVEGRYLYDSDGIRVKKWVRTNGTSTESIVYINGIFEHHRWPKNGEIKQNNHLHIMDDRQRIALVRRGAAHSNELEPKIQYHLGEHLGNSNVVVDGGGNWIDREEYFPYGETSFGSFAKKRYRFTSKERDEESGLYYYGARYYAPWLGRWASCDPAGLIDGSNMFFYTRDNPIAFRDPSGTQTCVRCHEPSQIAHHPKPFLNRKYYKAGITIGFEAAVVQPAEFTIGVFENVVEMLENPMETILGFSKTAAGVFHVLAFPEETAKSFYRKAFDVINTITATIQEDPVWAIRTPLAIGATMAYYSPFLLQGVESSAQEFSQLRHFRTWRHLTKRPAPFSPAKSKQLLKVNAGGTGEVPGYINLNPLKSHSGGRTKGIPNLIKRPFEQIGEIFKPGTVGDLISNRLRYVDIEDWPAGASGAFRVMAPGSEISMNIWASETQASYLLEVFRKAGFKNVQISSGGEGTMLTAVR
jgi:RHS repeat-associated protein